MTLRDRYQATNKTTVVKRMITQSVYQTMQLEGQPVPMQKIHSLYQQVQTERKNKGLQPS